ncbi:MAG: ABC transporter ATP-binding protein [Deltaproteobacteria bacterium]|nr:ABC transporter ATP-binding protein [Deltaproteobacteria bacterium]MBW2306817.1 ABC transporter ATP-binding protein [Deltaproteobacteria bacterium]
MNLRGIYASCRDIRFGYGRQEVLRGIHCTIEGGEFLGIIGPNGSGKTTFLKILNGELLPNRGEVLLDGESVPRMSRRQIAQKVAVVPQVKELAFRFTVLEMVMMGRSPHLGLLEFERRRDMETVQWAMEMTNISHLADRDLSELSGGEHQRVFIARALAQNPSMILMDEATAFLDIGHQANIMDLMQRLNNDQGMTIAVVTQDINLASAYCDRIVLFNAGRIHSIGTPGNVITKADIEKVYGLPVLVDTNPETGTPRVTLRKKVTFHNNV